MVDSTRGYARVSHSRQWSNYNLFPNYERLSTPRMKYDDLTAGSHHVGLLIVTECKQNIFCVSVCPSVRLSVCSYVHPYLLFVCLAVR